MNTLAKRVDAAVDVHTELIDWENNSDVQRVMRRDVKRLLRAEGGFEDHEHLDRLGRQIVEITKRRT